MTSFPYDTKATTFAEGSPVPPETLNAIQDAGIDVIGSHSKVYLGGHFDVADSWKRSTSAGYWEYVSGSGILKIDIPCREGARIAQVEVKIFGAVSGAWSIQLQHQDQTFDTSATAPGSVLVLDSDTPSPAAAWETVLFDATSSGGNLPFDVPAESRVTVAIVAASAGDYVAGVRVTFDRYLTATTEITV